jgi:hypothetical protein
LFVCLFVCLPKNRRRQIYSGFKASVLKERDILWS